MEEEFIQFGFLFEPEFMRGFQLGLFTGHRASYWAYMSTCYHSFINC